MSVGLWVTVMRLEDSSLETEDRMIVVGVGGNTELVLRKTDHSSR